MNGNMQSRRRDGCPDIESVSAYFDGELPASSPEARHIATCQECAKELKAFAELAARFKLALAEAVPADLGDKIVKAVEDERERAQSYVGIPFPRLVLRMAALFAVACGAAVFYFQAGKPVAPASAGTAHKAPAEDAMTAHFAVAPEDDDLIGGISFNNVIPVSSDGARMDYVIPGRQGRIATIGDNVRQVWVVKDLAKSAAALSGAMRRAGVKADDIAVDPEPGLSHSRILVAATMSKRQLAALVKECDREGFSLMSDAQPQPEQTLFSNQENEKVDYVADLVAE